MASPCSKDYKRDTYLRLRSLHIVPQLIYIYAPGYLMRIFFAVEKKPVIALLSYKEREIYWYHDAHFYVFHRNTSQAKFLIS
jgi:hypothetical protein